MKKRQKHNTTTGTGWRLSVKGVMPPVKGVMPPVKGIMPFVFLCLFIGLLINPATAEDEQALPGIMSWDAYLHDTGRTNTLRQKITFPLKESWKADLTPLADNLKLSPEEALSSPIISKGMMPLTGGVLYAGSNGSRFYAFNLKSGKLLWKFKTDSIPGGAAAAAGGKVYFGTLGGVFYCIDGATGKELWRFESKTEIVSSPAFQNDAVYFTSSDNRVYALKGDTGQKLWTYFHATAHYVAARFNNSPALSADRMFFTTTDGYLVALELSTGKELWKKKTLNADFPSALPRRVPSVETRADGSESVYVIDDKGRVLRFNGTTGEETARYSVVDAVDFIVSDKTMYLAGKDNIAALDSRTQEVLWVSRAFKGEPLSIFASEGNLFVLSNNNEALLGIEYLGIQYFERTYGYVSAFRMDDGRPAGTKKLHSRLKTNAAASENRIALETPDGKLIVLSSEEAWKKD